MITMIYITQDSKEFVRVLCYSLLDPLANEYLSYDRYVKYLVGTSGEKFNNIV